MSEKPFSIRLSEEEKEALERIAKSKDMSMADVIRMWITTGDVVNVLAEQLSDLAKDFFKWQLGSRGSSIIWLGRTLLQKPPIEEGTIVARLFDRESNYIEGEMARFIDTLDRFIKEVKIKKKEDLRAYIETFKSMVKRYEGDFVRTFYEIAEIMPEKDRDRVKNYYSDEFRVRFNEFAVKYEDFLTRATRELGYPLEETLGRAKQFPKARKPWRQPEVT